MSVPIVGRKAGCLTCTGTLLGRRHFIRTGALSLLGMSLSQYLRAESLLSEAGVDVKGKASAKSCILVWLEGGPSHIDMWDPKPHSSFRAISTNVPGIQVSNLLPRISKQMDKLSIIRSMRTEENNHGQGTYYAFTGHRPTAAMKFPSLGSIITKERGPRNHVPPYVVVPGFEGGPREEYLKSAFLGAQYDPMSLMSNPNEEDFRVEDLSLPKTLTPERLEDRRSLMALLDRSYRQRMEIAEHFKMDHFAEQALSMVTSPEVRNAFDLTQESEKTREAYGRTGFGQSLLLARRLVESGSRFVTAAGHDLNGWDAHAENDYKHKEKLVPGLDHALPVLLDDLKERGLLESTIVIAMGEFGRTPSFQLQGRERPLAPLLVAGARGGRNSRRIGGRSQRRKRCPCSREKGDHGRLVRHHLQSFWNRLDQGIHESHRSTDKDCQLD